MEPSTSIGSLPGKLPAKLVPQDIDIGTVQQLAQKTLENGYLDTGILQPSALWRDHLALTGQVRTFSSSEKIVEVWNKQVKCLRLTDIRTKAGRVVKPVPESSWIDLPFAFTTNPEG